jgi:hypothetical protein
VVPQGPNYALAKRIQHWRAMLHQASGQPVSSKIAPSTATISVIHNKSFAAAYSGFRFFKPMWVSFQETSNAVMAALLINDIKSPLAKLANPVELFRHGSFHGGIWRMAYKIGSIGEMATVLYYLGRIFPFVAAAVAGSATVAFVNANQ